MSNKYPVSRKCWSFYGYRKHLRKNGKRMANKSTRRLFEEAIKRDRP